MLFWVEIIGHGFSLSFRARF